MSYIGRGLQSGAFRQLDDISSGFDGSDTTHTMQVNSANVTVGDVNQILLSLGGVIQKPGTDFTVSGSVLTFTTAPAANTSFFAILLGSDNGGTVTPTDGSVTPGKTTFFNSTSLSDADLGAGLHIKTGDSGGSATSTADEIVVEGSGDMGIQLLGGASSSCGIAFGDSGDSNIGLLTYNHANNSMSIKTNDTIHMTIDSIGAVTKPLQPCFRVGAAVTNVAINSSVNVAFDSEVFDTNADFDTSTYTFTAPVTGKYHFEVLIRAGSVDFAGSYVQLVLIGSNRNTTLHTIINPQTISADTEYTFRGSSVLDMDANDTALVRIRFQGGTAQSDIDSDGSYFMGYLIG